MNESMLEGHGLATPLARTALFPATAVQMLRVGEETGSLDTQLEVTAEYYETELDYKIARADRPLRAGGDRGDGLDRRVRRDRARFRDVRSVPAGQGLMRSRQRRAKGERGRPCSNF